MEQPTGKELLISFILVKEKIGDLLDGYGDSYHLEGSGGVLSRREAAHLILTLVSRVGVCWNRAAKKLPRG